MDCILRYVSAIHRWLHTANTLFPQRKTMSRKLTEPSLSQRDEDERRSRRTRMQAALSPWERRQAGVPPCSGQSSLGEAQSLTCQVIAGRRRTPHQLHYLCMITDGSKKQFAHVNTKCKISVSHWQFLCSFL